MLHTERPIKERILALPRSAGVSHPLLLPFGSRPTKYKKWTDVSIQQAVEAVKEKKLSVRRAAEEFGVPKSTVHDRVSGRIPFGCTSGPERYLTDQEESELVNFLSGCASVGYAKSRHQVLALVEQVMREKGKTVSLSAGWWQSFKKRHPTLTLRTAAPVSYARAVSSSPEILAMYYDLLEKTISQNKLEGKPTQIFNMDETGFPLDPAPPLVVAPVGSKQVSQVTTGNKSQITVISCCSAAGYAMPPTVIFDRKSLRHEFTAGEVPGTTYALSSSGWVNSEIFCSWFHDHFLTHASPQRPILLLLDGHSSHFEPSVVRSAAEEGVLIFCLPPHTTHLTQPLDKGCFGPLKMFWREECHSYLSRNPGKVVTRYQFSELFGRAWMRGMTMTNILGGFRTTGVYPFNRNALQLKTMSTTFDSSSLTERTGLKFIPLYSPAVPQSQPRVATSASSDPCPFTPDEADNLPSSPPFNLAPLDLNESQCSDSSPPPQNTEDLSGDKEVELEQASKEAECVKTLHQTTTLSKCLSYHKPNIKLPKPHTKKAGCVLTSMENLQIIEKKEMEKREKAEKKERARLEREERRQQKREETKKKEQARLLRAEKRQQGKAADKGERKQRKKQRGSEEVKFDPNSSTALVNVDSTFTMDELQKFEYRYNEGYNLHHDQRYNLWLKSFHSDKCLQVAAPHTACDRESSGGSASDIGGRACAPSSTKTSPCLSEL